MCLLCPAIISLHRYNFIHLRQVDSYLGSLDRSIFYIRGSGYFLLSSYFVEISELNANGVNPRGVRSAYTLFANVPLMGC